MKKKFLEWLEEWYLVIILIMQVVLIVAVITILCTTRSAPVEDEIVGYLTRGIG